jgi:LL-diaminopimelate aminotransferase
VVVDAMQKAAAEMGNPKTFRGYPPDGGYPFLREAIAHFYRGMGVRLSADEIYISDGAKSDLGGILELFGDVPLLLPDPTYPVLRDAALLAGREVWYLPLTAEDGWVPTPEGLPLRPYIIYLCSPNNPTGVAYTKSQLAAWVRYARESGSVILYDAAYAAFASREMPTSIYQVRGAEKCAIEVGSFSKMAGFTGMRCGWSLFPKALDSKEASPRALWARRQGSRFNGVGYVISRAAEAALSPQGRMGSAQAVAYYRENLAMLANCLRGKGIPYFGGKDAPYLWVKAPHGMSSREAFQYLLWEAGILSTPGSGFGKGGEGYIRLSAFAPHEDTAEAVKRLKSLSYPVNA